MSVQMNILLFTATVRMSSFHLLFQKIRDRNCEQSPFLFHCVYAFGLLQSILYSNLQTLTQHCLSAVPPRIPNRMKQYTWFWIRFGIPSSTIWHIQEFMWKCKIQKCMCAEIVPQGESEWGLSVVSVFYIDFHLGAFRYPRTHLYWHTFGFIRIALLHLPVVIVRPILSAFTMGSIRVTIFFFFFFLLLF